MSNSQVKRPQWRRELQRGDRHAANAKRCCVRDVRKPNDGKVLKAVINTECSERLVPVKAFVQKQKFEFAAMKDCFALHSRQSPNFGE
ncbi:hypothetical protein [Sulfitobacter sp. JL08]|uniref:hypothetical protein n=1 Tax=Sulfitobacter sp. JL08 TaxID=2070369 RepID=UPI0013B46EF8|nr:hypothetical protein [Sulfitobacter sp. JL08]